PNGLESAAVTTPPVAARSTDNRATVTVAGESERRQFRRWSAIAASIVLTAMIFVVVLSKWPVFGERSREEAEVRAREAESSRISTLVPDPASDPAISPDGKLVAFRRNSYAPDGAGIFVTSSEGKGVMQLTQHPGDCCPAWSPDGQNLAFTRIA